MLSEFINLWLPFLNLYPSINKIRIHTESIDYIIYEKVYHTCERGENGSANGV